MQTLVDLQERANDNITATTLAIAELTVLQTLNFNVHGIRDMEAMRRKTN
jgi:hypothetical protein